MFVDFFDLAGYSPKFRAMGTEVVMKNRKNLSLIYVGIGSKIVGMSHRLKFNTLLEQR